MICFLHSTETHGWTAGMDTGNCPEDAAELISSLAVFIACEQINLSDHHTATFSLIELTVLYFTRHTSFSQALHPLSLFTHEITHIHRHTRALFRFHYDTHRHACAWRFGLKTCIICCLARVFGFSFLSTCM